MQKASKCPQCETQMQMKGKMEDVGQEGTITFYQCPNCKNIQIYSRQHDCGFRMDYP